MFFLFYFSLGTDILSLGGFAAHVSQYIDGYFVMCVYD